MSETVGTLNAGGVRQLQAATQFIVGERESGDRCAYDPQPDGRRYAACGDGVVANVAEWIALRLLGAIERKAAA